MTSFRVESDSLGEVKVPADCLWGAQTQRSLEHFCIGHDLMPRELIHAYAVLKKAVAVVNHAQSKTTFRYVKMMYFINTVLDDVIQSRIG